MLNRFVFTTFSGLLSIQAWAAPALSLPLNYPQARQEALTEMRFGLPIQSKYNWMENIHDPELDPWVKAQNQMVEDYLAGRTKDQVNQEVKAFLEASKKKESFSQKNFLRDQERQEYEMGKKRFSPSGFGFSSSEEQSANGKYSAVLESDSNRDLQYLRIKDNNSDSFLKDTLTVKFATVFWDSDESFVYAYEPDGRLGSNRSLIRRHTLGQTQANDEVLYEAQKSLQNLSLYQLKEGETAGRFFVIEEDNSVKTNVTVSWFDVKTGQKTLIQSGFTQSLNLMGVRDQKLYLTTFFDAPMGQILTIDLLTGTQKTVYRSQKYALDGALMGANAVYLTHLDESVTHLLSELDFTGDSLGTPKTIALPFQGNIELDLDDNSNLKIVLQSYSRPPTGWTLQKGTQTLLKTTAAKPTQIDLISRRVFYRAPNGKKAPIWLVYKKGVVLNTETPTLLYGYGGFAVNILPRYAARESRISFFKRGGVMAFVTLPGGQEFGEPWHQLGNLLNKRNVFDAFAEAGKQLIRFGFTSSAKLACNGGSNGGTLVGATINLYPELFRAAIPQVGVMDMTRFALFTGGKFWVPEYGNSNLKADFYNLLSYSPLHNIKATTYPATLVMTGSDDDRVVPMHSYKYAARLQELGSKKTPLLLHTDLGGSHGRSATESEKIRKATNFGTFLIQELGME